MRKLAFLAFAAVSGPLAAEPARLASFESWTAFTEGQAKDKVCFAVAKPEKSTGNYQRRGDVFTIVTHRPGTGVRDEISFVAGYAYPEKGEVELEIGRDKFKLFTDGERAWGETAEIDKKIATAMTKAGNMTVRGKSGRGTATTDSFSLAGFAKAYEAIGKACPPQKAEAPSPRRSGPR
jgi:Invasion associated locus B (IalB) protein